MTANMYTFVLGFGLGVLTMTLAVLVAIEFDAWRSRHDW